MAEDIIIAIDGIEGECKVAGHEGKIELSSWSFSVSNPGSYQQGGGGSTGKSMAGDLNCTKNLDKSSPNLMSYCASSKHIKTVVMVQRKQAGRRRGRRIPQGDADRLHHLQLQYLGLQRPADGFVQHQLCQA